MKTKLSKFILPVGMGLTLFTITVLGIASATFTGCTKEDVCKALVASASAKCCTTQGGIQVYGVTVPDNCTCPSNTTFGSHDVTYKVNSCLCKACK
jgi:hypothetical protein